jgi:cell wall-associated NlpC family hydrolase
VAIYAGDGLMVEAPDSAHSVRVVPVRDAGYAGARRYIS